MGNRFYLFLLSISIILGAASGFALIYYLLNGEHLSDLYFFTVFCYFDIESNRCISKL